MNIRCNRKKTMLKGQIANYNMCKKHKTILYGGCEICDDPWCSGPYCNMCGINYCKYATEKGERLFSYKGTVGINLYYQKTNIRFKKLINIE